MIKLIPLIPLLGFVINGLFGKKLGKTAVGAIGTGAVLASFLLTVGCFMQLSGSTTQLTEHVFTWLNVGGMKADFAFLVDHLSVWMMLIITGVGTLIHLYSIGYMHDDEGFHKFFAYLNLFIFSMLLLVMGSNFAILFFGWEGVGLCSYLLIGFWYTTSEYADAARKAFIMNRIGDLGLLLGMFLTFQTYGSIDFATVFAKAGSANVATITTITMLLFVGAMGKSAQIPLYTWLPDAMAGPTPVSALIHAATMVTAGIYMLVRSNALFSLAPATMAIVTYVGLITSIFAALIGLKQNDIKKVLAYSTVSQLGLMFIAVGVGAYSSAMFHLTTHAFFKALLFLGAGSVIHGMSGDQDIRNMGGLKNKMNLTFWTFTIGTLAIIGFPGFSGFFSKDEMLAATFSHSPVLWFFTVLSAALTAFYMLRMYYLTFFGDFRGTAEQAHHLHESPLTMTLPLMALAVLSALGGFLNMPKIMANGMQWFSNWMNPMIDGLSEHELAHSTEWMLMGTTTLVVFFALWFVYNMYVTKNHVPADDQDVSGIQKILANKFYIDELYDMLFVRPIERFSVMFHNIVDKQLIDGIVNGIGESVSVASDAVRRLQTGNIEFYLFCMVGGIILILLLNFLV
jgi:NADH-quinone oxidoreductase subunit L